MRRRDPVTATAWARRVAGRVPSVWEYEHSAEGGTTPAAIWRAWSEVERWGEWNADIEAIELDGPFAAGSTIAMTPRGAEPVQLRLEAVEENVRFVDVAELGGLTIRTEHRVEALADGLVRVTYRTQIEGPGSEDPDFGLGPAITADFPQTVAALLARAEAG